MFFLYLKTGAQLKLNVSMAKPVSPYEASVSGQTTIWALDPTYVADNGLHKEVNAEASNSVKTLHPVIGLQFRFEYLEIIYCLINFVNAKQWDTGV